MLEVADTLDLAYAAIGVKQALVDYGVIDSSRFEGELGFIQACIDWIEYLDQAWEPQEGEFQCVWCYEVAEPFRNAYGTHLLRGGESAEAWRILRSIVDTAIERG